MEAAKSVTSAHQENTWPNTEWSKFFVHLTIRVQTQCIRTIPTHFMCWRWPSQNTFRMCSVLYWTRSSRTQFDVSINVGRVAGETLNITCNFLYCYHQVHENFLITLYINSRRLGLLLGLITFIAHTTLWTENTSFTLSRFTDANCSEQTLEIGNSLFIIYDVAG
jgi:hypothetical protein